MMTTGNIYFDHNGTTQLDSRVLETMLPFLSSQYGNATSRHIYGRSARLAIDRAREQVADTVGAHPTQVVFTGSGTESNNLAITGIAANRPGEAVLISEIEHPCVTRPTMALQQCGWKVGTLAVNSDGMVDIAQLQSKLATPTSLVSAMLANNETGVIQPVAEIAEMAKRAGSYTHTDAVQALGKIKVDFSALNVQAMTISSHKINGPQGAGALILDKRVDIRPILLGGGQERGLRSGTENLAAIVGFGAACELVNRELLQRTARLRQMREQLENGIKEMGAVIFGQQRDRLPNTSFFAFSGIEGETLVMALDRKSYAVASGSACSSDSTEPSHVLLAMGVEPDLARGAIRVSLGASNTPEQIDGFLLVLKNELARLRQMAAIAV